MRKVVSKLAHALAHGGSLSALAAGLLIALPAAAQTSPPSDPVTGEQDASDEPQDGEILVTTNGGTFGSP